MQRLRVIVAAVRIRRSLRLRSQSGQVDMELVSEAEASDAGAIARAQWRGCVCRSTQRPLQFVIGLAQGMGEHVPARHSSPEAHVWSQRPQCSRLVCTLTHIEPHAVSSGGHADVSQLPLRQRRPIGQTLPQRPQFAPSKSGLVQAPPQTVSPGEHSQAPFRHT